MSSGPEYTNVEQPFIDHLVSMGWKWTTGNVDFPSATGRSSFREVLLLDDLKTALRRINPDDQGKPWLDDARIATAVSAVERISAPKLMEANQVATEVLLKGVPVEGLPGWDGGRTQTVKFFDWNHTGNNTFRVINQFKVEEPGGQTHKHIIPDLVLFVNGIPLVVVECKSPYLTDPLAEGIEQLQRYANQRHWVDGNEGNERLFFTNQFMVATCFEQARVGTIGAQAHHFMEWKDTAPIPKKEVAAALGKDGLSRQETLVAGMLRPENLLDIVRHFILFKVDNGKTIKVVTRYQQYRAVLNAVERLETGKTRAEDGEQDRRGGIIWHTQGSGKSLTMVFLVRKMRTNTTLRKFKVVVVTDRKDLQKQLADTAELSGETVKIAKRIISLKEMLAEKGPGLVFAMIQKYQERDFEPGDEDDPDADEGVPDDDKELGVVIAAQAHRNVVVAQLTQRLTTNLAAVDLRAQLLVELVGDLGRGDGAIQLAAVAGAGGEGQRDGTDLLGQQVMLGAQFGAAGLGALAPRLGLLHHVRRGLHGQALGQQEVAAEAVGHSVNLAGIAQIVNVFS